MAITKKHKNEIVQTYADLLDRSNGIVLTNNLGLNMKQLTALRAGLRAANAEFHITKNTLVKVALKDKGYDVPAELLTGPTAIGFAFEELPAVAKAIVDFSRKSDERIVLKGGVMDGKFLNATEIAALAQLPPLPVMRAQLLSMISAPATQLAGVMAGGIRQVVSVLKAYSEKEDGDMPVEAAA